MRKRTGTNGMPPRWNARSGNDRIWSRLCRLSRVEDGVSAVEFALLAPMLVFALLATVDLGRALTERMQIDQVLRAGAQSATAGGTVADIDRVLRSAAATDFRVAESGFAGDDSTLALTVSRVCACAERPEAAAACSTTCAGSAPTQIYFVLSGQKDFSGIILPRFSLSPAVQVQIR